MGEDKGEGERVKPPHSNSLPQRGERRSPLTLTLSRGGEREEAPSL